MQMFSENSLGMGQNFVICSVKRQQHNKTPTRKLTHQNLGRNREREEIGFEQGVAGTRSMQRIHVGGQRFQTLRRRASLLQFPSCCAESKKVWSCCYKGGLGSEVRCMYGEGSCAQQQNLIRASRIEPEMTHVICVCAMSSGRVNGGWVGGGSE